MSLIKAIIKINGSYYAGECSEIYNSSIKGLGWYDYKTKEINRLKFVSERDAAYMTEGSRNLKSTLDKIFQRIQDQELEFDKIEIIKLKEGFDKLKFDVYETRLGEEDSVIAIGLTEEEADKIVNENPKIRIAIPSIINGG